MFKFICYPKPWQDTAWYNIISRNGSFSQQQFACCLINNEAKLIKLENIPILIQEVTLFELLLRQSQYQTHYSKTCLERPLKIDKTKILMTNGNLMKVESIAECSPWSILQYFWPSLRENRPWKPIFDFFERGRFIQVLLYHQFGALGVFKTTSLSEVRV